MTDSGADWGDHKPPLFFKANEDRKFNQSKIRLLYSSTVDLEDIFRLGTYTQGTMIWIPSGFPALKRDPPARSLTSKHHQSPVTWPPPKNLAISHHHPALV